MTCGIYYIENTKNNKVYIGSSIHCEYRFKQHKKELNHQYHANDHLQKSFKKYGIENFEFNILEECPENLLIKNEDKWMNEFKSLDAKFGFNKQNASRSILTMEAITNHKTACNTPEFKEKSSNTAKKHVWGNEEVKKELLKNQWEAMHTDEHKKLKSDISQNIWNDNPNQKKRFSEVFKIKWDEEESPNRNKEFEEWRGSNRQKEIMREKMKARWADPIQREQMVAARKKFGKDPKFKEKIAKISRERWKDNDFKQKLSDIKKTSWKDETYRKMMISSRQKNYQNQACIICKNMFMPRIHNQTTCSKECKNAHRRLIRKLKKENSPVRAKL